MPSLPLLARRLIDVSSFSLIRINSLLCCLRYIFSNYFRRLFMRLDVSFHPNL